MVGSERPDSEAGWDGFGYQAKISRYHPTGNREPEQGGESWKLNGGERWAAGWSGGPMRGQRQQDRAVSIVPL